MMRFVTAFVLMALTAAAVVLNPPENLALGRGVLKQVPAAFGPWSGTELSFEDAVVEELQADDILIRRYENGSQPVWLCIVYHQNRRYGAHDPLLCYESQGFVIEREGHARIADGSPEGLEVNTFQTERQKLKRVVWYWWTTNGLSTSDVGAFRRRMAFTGALDNRSWGAFVRVESVAPDGDLDAARARVEDFATRVAREMPGVFARAVAAPAATGGAAPAADSSASADSASAAAGSPAAR
ncbi:MAG: EpsI family protein [Candidatus Eisenbacteria bacterium]|uniref:EpsI family protein n=1 Tax=Eiseniibacteriota bacterium TaxID=2212470 RepID=A0A933SEG7_UNCEI|nr:EpsI family protein [Candidatus Eisenbacteria bacterium]